MEEDRADDLPDRTPARDVDVAQLPGEVVVHAAAGEEGPELRPYESPADRAVRVRVLEDDPDRVIAVEVAGLAEDRLRAAVVELRLHGERGGVEVRRAVVVRHGPAGQRAGDLGHV